MTTGRPSIRPKTDHDTPVVSGLGAGKCEVGDTADDDQFLCGMYEDQDGIFGVEDDVGEELKISEAGGGGAGSEGRSFAYPVSADT